MHWVMMDYFGRSPTVQSNQPVTAEPEYAMEMESASLTMASAADIIIVSDLSRITGR